MNHMTAMKKTLRLWMLLVVTLNIVSCVDLNDNPVGIHSPIVNDPEYCPAEIKQEVMDFISSYIY